MRAGAWSTVRDITAARDELGTGTASLPMHYLPTMRTVWRCESRRERICVRRHIDRPRASIDSGFEELRELCAVAGDKRSLAMAMLGQIGGAHGAGPGP